VTPAFRLEVLGPEHNRADFASGEPALDRYQATQDVRRRIANCFVAVETATSILAGFYTLSAASLPLAEIPEDLAKRLPRYPTVPAVRIGRLATDLRFRGRGIGAGLLADAFRRCMTAPPAVFTLLVDAKNDAAAAFYQHHGFRPLADAPRTLFLPLATAEKTLTKPGTSPSTS
jgi:ribosomal protein S18 acetylase RimI-like enzyme